MDYTVPEYVIVAFRRIALEHLEAFDGLWRALKNSGPDATVEADAKRHLHTLSGDAGMVGFSSVAAFVRRLESLLALAAEKRFQCSPAEWEVMERSIASLVRVLRVDADPTIGARELEALCGEIDPLIHAPSS